MIRIYIPTHNRNTEQRAYHQLDQAGLRPVLVVDVTDDADYKGFRVLRASVKGIAQKRQWILDHAGPLLHVQVDDDITFSLVEHVGGKCLISPASNKQCKHLFEELAPAMLETFAHGGMHTRHFVNGKAQPYVQNSGYYRQVAFFNPRLFKGEVAYWPAKLKTSEDISIMLQLIRQQLPWFLITQYCMVEKEPRGQPQTWSQELKDKDYKAFIHANKLEPYLRHMKNRSVLSWSAIYKAALKGTL